MSYVPLFAAGFLGSFHCVGMCGGFACALGRDGRGSGATILRHLLYNCGRLTTYCFLGGLAGALGQAMCAGEGISVTMPHNPIGLPQRLLAIVSGALMIVMAMQFFGWFQGSRRVAAGFGSSTLATSLRSLLSAHGAAAPLAFGVFNGFLPCPLVYAIVAKAASTAAPLSGIWSMAAFGLGTFPAMLLMGRIGQLLRPAWRLRGVRLAGSCLLLLGMITLARGIVPVMGHVHQAT